MSPFPLHDELPFKNFKFNFSFVKSNDITAYQNRLTNPHPVPKLLISVNVILPHPPHPIIHHDVDKEKFTFMNQDQHVIIINL